MKIMLHEKYHDPVRVYALFEGSRIIPHFFEWGKYRYEVNRVLVVHSIHDGRERIYYFSVANQSDFFKLAFHTKNLQWFLIEHYQE